MPRPLNTLRLSCVVATLFVQTAVADDSWPGFRGPRGSGVTDSVLPLPDKIDPDANLLWKTAVAKGISSPVIANGRVYLTMAESGPKLSVLALDANDGKTLWQAEAPVAHKNKGKNKGKRLATATPVTDGQLVISFFDAFGLLCHDRDGKLLWKKPFGPLENRFNHAASPVLVDDRVILVVDHDGDSFVVALNKRTGEQIWRSDRFVFGRNYASPIVASLGDRRFVVVAGSGLTTGYDVETGEPKWFLRGTSAVVNPTPVAAGDWLFVSGSSPPSGAKSSQFSGLLKKYDKNNDSALQAAELPACFLKSFVGRFDSDKNGGVDQQEYKYFQELSQPFVKGMSAWKLDGDELTQRESVWNQSRSMPRTPSALYKDDVLYVVSEGGILQSINAKTGELIHKGRIAARGTIYSSPALGDGKIYFGTRDGEVAVVSAEPEWKNLHSAKLDGEIQASISIAGGRVYFRTEKSLYCFGK